MSDDATGTPAGNAAADEAFSKLCDDVSLQLRLNRVSLAASQVEELLARWPESTTAHELAGDVAAAQGKMGAARKEYQAALKLEPANVDAERKYGMALLTQTPEERRRALISGIIADPTAHRSTARKPLNSVLNALVFPGLGQLHNREHEKGLVFVGVSAIALIVILYIVLPYASASVTLGSAMARASQRDGAQRVVDAMSGGKWTLVIFMGLIFTALYLWGIFDAWKQAQSEAEDTLGVR